VYFGYDVAIEPQTEPNTYRLSFSPLTLSPQQIVRDNPAAWTTFSTPGWGGPPSPRTVRAGEVVVLNLLTNRATGQQITDYVTVQEPPRPAVASFSNGNRPPREFAFEDGQARDFRVEDAEMRLRDPRLTVNGKFQSGTASLNTEVKGAVVWFYAPSRGRYLLSLSTHPGFSKAGEVRGTTLNFVDGKDAFNLVAAGPIAPGDAAFTLYVAHDPSWKPTYPNADTNAFILGAADRAEYLRR
jgi:hypothetical protein